MKFTKFLFAGAFCAGALTTSLHAAECSYEPPVRESGSTGAYFEYPAVSLYLFEGSYLDLSKMDQREPTVKNVSGTDTVWMYRSKLDSTMIVIASEKGGQGGARRLFRQPRRLRRFALQRASRCRIQGRIRTVAKGGRFQGNSRTSGLPGEPCF